MNEYGGYIPLEIPIGKGEYYSGKSVVAVDKGRSAILLAVLSGGFKKIYLPYYTCPSINDFLRRESDIEISFYNIDSCFRPVDIKLHEKECILWTNYFGVMNHQVSTEMIQRFGQSLIVDDTQAFYHAPCADASFVYSCRKFFGVSDGAYLWKRDGVSVELNKGTSSDACVFLAKAYEFGTNGSYDDYLVNEEIISHRPMLKMSGFTQRILQSIDYKEVYQRRHTNFMELDKYLGNYNKLLFVRSDIEAPQVYPLLIENELLRDYLIEKKIYIPRWWKKVIIEDHANEFEKYLARYLLPLPIDQRYDSADMQVMAGIILDFLGG